MWKKIEEVILKDTLNYIVLKGDMKEVGSLLKFAPKCANAEYFSAREFRLSLIFKSYLEIGANWHCFDCFQERERKKIW